MDTPLGQSTVGEMLPLFIISGILLCSIIFLLSRAIIVLKIQKQNRKQNKIAKEEKLESLRTQGVTQNVTLKHMIGLPVPEGFECEISSYPTKISISGNGMQFNLDKNKLIDVCVKTDVEIQNQYVSSVGGAVGGAILFGGLGAMIGGRAKLKQARTVSKYLIFSYSKDNNINYISFDVLNYLPQAMKFVDEFKEIPKNDTVIEL